MNDPLMVGRRGRAILLALLASSVIAVALLLFRRFFWGDTRLGFLPKNLFLAWLPLVFACVAQTQLARPSRRHWLFAICAVGWFFFWPNAAYIVTDMLHLKEREEVPRLFDVILLTFYAWIGLFLSYLSLFLMHSRVRGRFGASFGWLFVVVMLAAGSFGIYLGRFLRTNSWHVVTHPLRVIGDVLRATDAGERSGMATFSLTFFIFSTAVYLMLHALANLHAPDAPVTAVTEKPLS